MNTYTRVKKETEQRSSPQQILVFGSQWRHVIESFMQVFMSEPVLVTTSTYESAIFGKVKQVWGVNQILKFYNFDVKCAFHHHV